MSHFPETERLYFREFTLADAQMLYDMHQDPEITRYTGDPIPWDNVALVEQILKDTIMPQYAKKIGRWAVHLKADDTFIGWCGLKDIGHEVDLGYRYIQKYWGKGYATEAAQAVLEYGLQNNIPNIIGRASIHNGASVKVLEKIGLIYKERYIEEDGEESIKFTAPVR
jgi:[ribosomal protein S5]-alanine N-acetyltransferase